MPPKLPENKQPKKKPPITKRAEPANKSAKNPISNSGTSATAKPAIASKAKTKRPDIPYPGPSMALSEELRERIAQRAFEIHQRRGGQHGSDWEDWLQAEREILLHQRPSS
jgi:hypothetical protein